MNLGKIDHLGRVRLHREMLERLGWEAGQELAGEMTKDMQGIEIRMSKDVCAHCGESNPHELIPVDATSAICLRCLDKAKKSIADVASF